MRGHCTRLVIAVVLLAAGLEACSSSGGSSSPAASSPASGTPPTQATSPPASSPPSGPAGTETPLTLAGTVVRGVEPGCTLLRTRHGDYLLLGELAARVGEREGAKWRVLAYPMPGVKTHCQQGLAVHVVDASPLLSGGPPR